MTEYHLVRVPRAERPLAERPERQSLAGGFEGQSHRRVPRGEAHGKRQRVAPLCDACRPYTVHVSAVELSRNNCLSHSYSISKNVRIVKTHVRVQRTRKTVNNRLCIDCAVSIS